MSTPVGVAGVEPVPHGHTARRLTWRFLPHEVRDLVQRHLGSPVVDATSQDSGFTPGFASVLTGESGAQLFVKAASRIAQSEIAASYAEEARKMTLLGRDIPSPRLEWVGDEADWVVLGFEAVDARMPSRPWLEAELERALDLAEEIADATRTVPDGLKLKPIVEDIPRLVTGWEEVPEDWPHRHEASVLAARMSSLPHSDRFAHLDLRDDNILFASDGRTLACDWNWPALAPAWLDLVVLLVSAYGDDHDVEPLLAKRSLTRDVDPEHIDTWLAALCGFMLASRTRPVPPSAPYLRTHNAWYAEASWAWLAQRRGWS